VCVLRLCHTPACYFVNKVYFLKVLGSKYQQNFESHTSQCVWTNQSAHGSVWMRVRVCVRACVLAFKMSERGWSSAKIRILFFTAPSPPSLSLSSCRITTAWKSSVCWNRWSSQKLSRRRRSKFCFSSSTKNWSDAGSRLSLLLPPLLTPKNITPQQTQGPPRPPSLSLKEEIVFSSSSLREKRGSIFDPKKFLKSVFCSISLT